MEESMAIAKKAGVEIIYPEKPLFKEKAKSVLQEFQKNYPEFDYIINEIQK